MTNEEAKTVLINSTTFIKDGFRFMKEEHQEQFKEAYRVALQALEKQIPKNPRKYKASKDFIYFECPRCDNKIQADVKYCRYCGQALDWSI